MRCIEDQSDGVIEMYRRSINNYSIRYNPFIGDCDSSAYSTIDRESPYDATVFVRIEECVNHVTKRMETNLRRMVKEYKGKKLEDGKTLSRKGRLTSARIDAIQNFYGRTICDNKGNTEQMSKEIWAILYHYASTADKLMHTNCPTGHQSWCGYQKDIANETSTYKPVKHPLSEAIVKLAHQSLIVSQMNLFQKVTKTLPTKMLTNRLTMFYGVFAPKSDSILHYRHL